MYYLVKYFEMIINIAEYECFLFLTGLSSVQEKANGIESKKLKNMEHSNKMHFEELSGFCL